MPFQEEIDRKEKMTAGLNQTVQELQELLQSVNRQLTKRHERVGFHCWFVHRSRDGFLQFKHTVYIKICILLNLLKTFSSVFLAETMNQSDS